MSGIMLAVAYLGAVGPPRARLGLPERPDGRGRMDVILGGAILALLGVWALAAWSGPLLDALEVSTETFRLAAGIVIAVAAMIVLARPRPADEPEARGMLAAVWPVAYPRLLTVEVVALALTTGTKEGVGATMAGAASAVSVAVVLGMLRRTPLSDRVLEGAARMVALLLVVTAVFLMIDGIRDV